MNSRQTVVREAFDRHALTYDEAFSCRTLAQDIREQVWAIADSAFGKAQRIIDLGCGTGEDSIHFARLGRNISAVDLSPQMIARVKEKAASAALSDQIQCTVSEMNAYTPDVPVDALISNFGAINCLPDLAWMRNFAQRSLNSGAPIVLTTMGRCYPLESVMFLLKGEFKKSFRRFRRRSEAVVEGVRFDVYYHSVGSMKHMLGPSFHLQRVVGLRAFLPAPGLEHLERFGIFRYLEGVDRRFCANRRTASFADHFVTLWRYEP